MNRRQFLKSGAVVAAAVAVAPAVVAETMKFHTGGIVPDLYYTEGTETVLEGAGDYFSIQWPVTTQTYCFGAYVGKGRMEHRSYVGSDGCAYLPPQLESVKDLRFKYVPAGNEEWA